MDEITNTDTGTETGTDTNTEPGTGTDIEPVEDPIVEEPTGPRSIDQLMDLPYSEMTEEEIELLVEWKAEIKARDTEYETRMKAYDDMLKEQIDIAKEQVKDNKAALDELMEQARARFENAESRV